MSQTDIAAAYSKIARSTEWRLVVDTKVFDDEQTSIIRIFKHASGQIAIYAASSTDGKTSNKALASVLHSVAEAIAPVATEAGCVSAAIEDAVAKAALLPP